MGPTLPLLCPCLETPPLTAQPQSPPYRSPPLRGPLNRCPVILSQLPTITSFN